MFCRVTRVPCITGSGLWWSGIYCHQSPPWGHITHHTGHSIILSSSDPHIEMFPDPSQREAVWSWPSKSGLIEYGQCHLDIHVLAAQYDHIMYVTIKSLTMFMSHFLISLIHLDHLDLMKWPSDRTWDGYNCSFEGNTGNMTINPKSSVHKV